MYFALPVTEPSGTQAGRRGAFRERAEEDYSDSFWLADFAFFNRPVPISVLPVIRYAKGRVGESLEKREREGVQKRLPALR